MVKNILFSAAMLASLGSAAVAEVSLSGDARMGVTNGFVLIPGNKDTTAFSSRARLAFTMTGETDGGLAFGAVLRADNAVGAAAGLGGAVFISGAFGKISMGDVDGAAQTAVGQVDGVGYAGLGSAEELVFLGGGGNAVTSVLPTASRQAVFGTDPTALYEYSSGALAVFVSASNPSGTFAVPNPPPAAPDEFEANVYSVGASYQSGGYKFALGYESSEINRFVPAAPTSKLGVEQISLGADLSFGQVVVKARLVKADLKQNGTQFATLRQSAVSATYKVDALSVTGFASQRQLNLVVGIVLEKFTTYGLGASYDLGGGATLAGGIATQQYSPGPGLKLKDTAFDLGIKFAF